MGFVAQPHAAFFWQIRPLEKKRKKTLDRFAHPENAT
jgi:hypothetical protein